MVVSESILERYRSVISELESREVMPDRAPSLEPTQTGLAELGLDIDPRTVILVAGTNGKGSVATTLAELLKSQGHRVGLYTSPHLMDTCERIQIDQEAISQKIFLEAFDRLQSIPGGPKLTHFESLTLMAAWIFDQKTPCDYKIFEVGLGGTWDATNAIPHQTSVITTIGLDHQHLLGDTLESIADNKFGIVRSWARQTTHRVVLGQMPTELAQWIQNFKAEHPAHWIDSAPIEFRQINGRPPATEVFFPDGWARINLAGPRGAQNIQTAWSCYLEALGGQDNANARKALTQVQWPGRFEWLEPERFACPVVLSGDHNGPGIRSLIPIMESVPRRQLHLLIGIGRHKDQPNIMRELKPLNPTQVIFTESNFMADSARALAQASPWPNARALKLKEALDVLQDQARADDLILVTGSIYLVGDVKKALTRER